MMDYKYLPQPHVLAIPYPSQGHVNPMLQLCKRLVSKGAKSTLAITEFISKSFNPKSETVNIDTFSDGFDQGGFNQSDGVEDYLTKMEIVGSRTLQDLIDKYGNSNRPVDCIIYDAFLPWAMEVAKKNNIKVACLFTQACSINYVYYYVHHGMLKLPVTTPPLVEIPGLPPLEASDLPSFMYVHGSYPAYFEMVLNQFYNLEKADFVLVNTFYKLEEKVIDSMSRVCPMLTIGPTIPSYYLDNRVENDKTYSLNLFEFDSSSAANVLNWLDAKPKGSVIYVAFGSMDGLSKPQLEEIAYALRNTDFDFLWAIRDSARDEKLPQDFVQEASSRDKGLFVHWSPQLQVLSNEAVGCFLSHGGWNSTIEALSLGVPMAVMPQWTDQPMDAKLVQDVWKFGVRVISSDDDEGSDHIVKRDVIERCVREVMMESSENGKEMKKNAEKWRALAVEAVSEGGTSDKNIHSFISQLLVSDP